MNVAQRSLIHSMSSSSALNLMAATTTHNQLNQINSLDHNYYERELNDPLDDHLQVKKKSCQFVFPLQGPPVNTYLYTLREG